MVLSSVPQLHSGSISTIKYVVQLLTLLLNFIIEHLIRATQVSPILEYPHNWSNLAHKVGNGTYVSDVSLLKEASRRDSHTARSVSWFLLSLEYPWLH